MESLGEELGVGYHGITNSFENGSILQEIDFVGNILIWTARLPEELFGV